MPVQTEHRFHLDLNVLDAAGSRVTPADLRGQAQAVAVYFMRTGTCPVCIPPRPHPGPAGPTRPRRAAGRGGTRPADARRPGPGASSATGSPSCPATAPRRTWPRDCTGPCSFNTVASC
jgi:hypothetical protein